MAPTNSAGRVIAISISKKRGIAKKNIDSVRLIENFGLEGDVHGGDWHRQVSFLALESIHKMWEKGVKVRPGGFAENITTEFIDIPHLAIGSRVQIGEAELEITQIGKECHQHCAIYYQAGDCVMPREGIFAIVKKGGEIRVEDPVNLLAGESSALNVLPTTAEGGG